MNTEASTSRLERILARYPLGVQGTSVLVGDWRYRLTPADGSPHLPIEVERAVVTAIGATPDLLRELKASRYAIRVLLQALDADPATTTISAPDSLGRQQSLPLSDLLARIDNAIQAVDI